MTGRTNSALQLKLNNCRRAIAILLAFLCCMSYIMSSGITIIYADDEYQSTETGVSTDTETPSDTTPQETEPQETEAQETEPQDTEAQETEPADTETTEPAETEDTAGTDTTPEEPIAIPELHAVIYTDETLTAFKPFEDHTEITLKGEFEKEYKVMAYPQEYKFGGKVSLIIYVVKILDENNEEVKFEAGLFEINVKSELMGEILINGSELPELYNYDVDSIVRDEDGNIIEIIEKKAEYGFAEDAENTVVFKNGEFTGYVFAVADTTGEETAEPTDTEPVETDAPEETSETAETEPAETEPEETEPEATDPADIIDTTEPAETEENIGETGNETVNDSEETDPWWIGFVDDPFEYPDPVETETTETETEPAEILPDETDPVETTVEDTRGTEPSETEPEEITAPEETAPAETDDTEISQTTEPADPADSVETNVPEDSEETKKPEPALPEIEDKIYLPENGIPENNGITILGSLSSISSKVSAENVNVYLGRKSSFSDSRIKTAAQTLFSENETETYLNLYAEGSIFARVTLRKFVPETTSGTAVLEAYKFVMHSISATGVRAELASMPLLANGESVALYGIKDGKLGEPVMVCEGVGSAYEFNLSEWEGFALVKVIPVKSEITSSAGTPDGHTVYFKINGVVPEGSEIKAELAEGEFDSDAILAYDISIADIFGREYQPDENNPVSVKIKSSVIERAIASGLIITVTHYDEEGNAEEIEITDIGDNFVTFNATSFSVYTINASNPGKNLVSYHETREGTYSSVVVSGTCKKIPVLNMDSVVGKDNVTIVESWDLGNIKNGTSLKLYLTVNQVPELEDDEYFALYLIKNGTLVSETEYKGETFVLDVAFKGNTGVALAIIKDTVSTDLVPDNAIWANDDIYLTGKMPGNAVVDATPVTVTIDGEEVICAYDVKIYANENQRKKGKTWQPAGDKVKVHFRNAGFEGIEELNVYHFGDEAELVKTTKAENNWIEFDAGSFSIYAVSTVILEKTITASDGNTYLITASYDTKTTGIPSNTVLEVREIGKDEEGFDGYIKDSLDVIGAENYTYARAFDIRIVNADDNSISYQPAEGTMVNVSIKLMDAQADTDDFDVVHFGEQPTLISSTTTENTVIFKADGFSVYVIIDHEGSTSIGTPRVEFHFINEKYTGNNNPYTAAPYNFYTKANPVSYQSTQILTNNESLEMISNPPNISVESYYLTTDSSIVSGKTYYTYDSATGVYTAVDTPVIGEISSYYEMAVSEKFFYGWYVVELEEASNVAYTDTNGDGVNDKWTGSISYNWTNDPQKISFEKPMTLSQTTGLTVGDTISWTIDRVTLSGVLDSKGLVHVYLAPIYEDYYFVNFRMAAYGSSSALTDSLITRRLAVFGSASSVSIHIGDIKVDSTDPTHRVFVGWQTAAMSATNDYYETIDENGNEQNSIGSTNGYYITLQKSDFAGTMYDLYPLFVEARWLSFNNGKSGNGATYVGATYRLTNDEGHGSPYNNAFFNANTSIRNGYLLEGWYAFAAKDSNGEITNISSPQEVEFKYVDSAGDVQTVTFNMTAMKLVQNNNGVFSLVTPANNASLATTTVSGTTYTLSVSGGIVYLAIDGGTPLKIFGVENNQLWFYKTMDDLTIHAKWEIIDTTTYRVVIWKQKVTDSVFATDAEKTYDYEIFYTSNPVSTTAPLNLRSFSGTGADGTSVSNSDLLGRSYTGFHYSSNDSSITGTPEPDGTSVYNVYYDRDPLTMTFYTYSRSGYAVTTSNSGTQYAFINNEWVELSYDSTSGEWRIPERGVIYNPSTEYKEEMYGLVGDTYVLLTPEKTTSTAYTDIYKQTDVLEAGNDYIIVGSNNGNYVLSRNGQSPARVAITVNNGTTATGNKNYVLASDVGSTSVFTVESGYKFKNGVYYMGRNGNNLQFNNNGSNWTWDSSNSILTNTDNNRYLRYSDSSSNFTLGNNYTSYIKLYEKSSMEDGTTTTITGYTYNGEPYMGQRYSKDFGLTGNYVTYTGTRYTESSGYNAWRIYKVFNGLYGQTLVQNGYTWPTEYDWYANGGNNGGTSGTHTTFLDIFNTENSHSYYGSSVGTGTYSFNHYKQNVDGSWPEIDEWTNQTTKGSSNSTWTFSEKYDGFTVRYYLLSSRNNAITRWDNANWTTTSANGSVTVGASNLYIRYERQKFDFTFDVNYPDGAGVTYNGITVANGANRSSNLTVDPQVYYEASLADYGSTKSVVNGVEITNWYYGVVNAANTATNTLIAPDHYIFGGWYEDATCQVPFNFDSTMPAANKIVYAKWTPERFLVKIDPNGGEIDHVDHGYANPTGYSNYYWSGDKWGADPSATAGKSATAYPFATFNRAAVAGERPADTGYNRNQSTYINATYGTLISEYTVERNYVAISDAAADSYTGTIYYYVNTQWSENDGSGLPSDCRNALYMTEAELHQYYLFYRDWVQGNIEGGYITGTTLYNEDTWRQLYTSFGKQQYRYINNQEHYEFMGWYQVFNEGTSSEYLGTMPYVFSTPVDSPVTLRAVWRLDGGYKIQYHADYTMDDGTLINGDMEHWVDPKSGDFLLSYADGASTNVYKQPTNIRIGDQETDEYIFRGFRIVNVTTDINGHVNYRALERDSNNEVIYYDPGDPFIVSSAFADSNSIIHLQAVYEEVDSSYRRPYVTNLTLDSNGGYLVNADGSTMTDNTNLTTISGWNGIGTVSATVKDPVTGDPLGLDQLIEFGDIQSNVALHLYRYATKLTRVGGNPDGAELDPAGTNYFVHPKNFFLLGFDEIKNEGDFIATYGADSIIAIDRNQSQTLYAVWEPMIYLNFVNNTSSTINFGLSSTDVLTMYILNEVTGLYDREKVTDPSNMSLAPGQTMHLALPYGEEQNITIEGTNELGVGKILTWNTSITDDDSEITYTSMDEPIVGADPNTRYGQTSYTHNTDCEHILASGKVNSTDTEKDFSFEEKLLFNSKGVTVIFDDENNDYALTLLDNYNGDGSGGGVQEYDFTKEQIEKNPSPSLLLPSTSTRMGYQLLGWAYSYTASTPDFATINGWTIENLKEFFQHNSNAPGGQWPTINDGDTVQATLYAVWGINKKASTVYIYKDVPDPGNKNMPFTFTLDITGRYTRGYSYTDNSGSKTFQLYHGDYAVLKSTEKTAEGCIRTEIMIYQANGEDRVTNYIRTSDVSIDSTKTYYTYDSTTRVYTSVGSPVASNLSSYYEAANVLKITASNADNGGSWNYVHITVTETPVSYYDTTVSCSAQNTDKMLYIGSHGNSETPATLNTPVDGNVAHWDATDAGGTLVFTNQRQTYDITLSKVLHSNTSIPGTFPMIAKYTVDGQTVTLSKQITSGTTDTTWLANLPAGALLTLYEGNDGSYITKYKIDDGALNDAISVFEAGSQIYAKTTEIEIDADKTIVIDNTLKSYPVKFRLMDQNGVALSGMFSLSSSIGSMGNQLYADPNHGGIFYPNNYPTVQSANLYVDTYTLSENIIPTGYIGLSTPATITVSGTGENPITTNSDMIVISEDPDVSGGYIITVYNIVPSVNITLTKVLDDPFLNQRTFSFTVGYEYELYDSISGNLLKTIRQSNTYDIQATRAGVSEVISVPGGAVVTITENMTAALTAVYDTTVTVDGGTPAPKTTWSETVSNEDKTVVFTNSRKKINVTIEKNVIGTGGVFSFTVLLQNGSTNIVGWTLNNNGTGLDASDDLVTGDGTNGTTAGQAEFTLTPGTNGTAQIVLTIPYGSVFTVTEVGGFGYTTNVSINSGSPTEHLTAHLTAAQTVEDLTVTFTNTEIKVAPTAVNLDSRPYTVIFGIGALLVLFLIVSSLKRRKLNEDPEDPDPVCTEDQDTSDVIRKPKVYRNWRLYPGKCRKRMDNENPKADSAEAEADETPPNRIRSNLLKSMSVIPKARSEPRSRGDPKFERVKTRWRRLLHWEVPDEALAQSIPEETPTYNFIKIERKLTRMKTFKRISSIVLALAMVLTMSAFVFADIDFNNGIAGEFNETAKDASLQVDTDKTITIQKEITAYNPAGLDVHAPVITYTYTVTAGEAGKTIVDDKDYHESATSASVQTKAGIITDLQVKGSTNGTAAAGFTSGNTGTIVWNNEGTLKTAADGKANIAGLQINFANVAFNGAGVYRYVITETVSAYESNGVVKGDHPDSDVRYLDVYVKDGATAGTYDVYGYVCFKNNNNIDKENAGPGEPAVAAAEKTNGFVDPDPATGVANDKADKYYTFNVEIEKKLVGDQAMNNHEFPFNVTFANGTVLSTVLLTLDKTGNATVPAAASAKLSDTAYNGTITIANGGKVKIIGIPAGTTVTIDEKNDVTGTTYKVKTEGGTSNLATKTVEWGKWAKGGDAADAAATALGGTENTNALVENDIAIKVTNTLEQISPTGYVARIAPYAAILGTGIVLLVVARKFKKDDEEEFEGEAVRA